MKLRTLKPRIKTAGVARMTMLSNNPNATERQRGRAWMTRRERLLRANPLCKHCAERGLVRAATQVDHIIPLVLGGPDINSNTQNLCDDCHAAKSAIDGSRQRPAGSIG